MKSLSRVRLFVTPWTAAYQAPLPMGFPRQEYWSGLPLPSPRERLPTPISLSGELQRATVHRVTKSQTRLSDFTFTFHFHSLEKETATHSSIVAWRIPRTGAWWAAVHGVVKSRTRLKRLHFHIPLSCIGEGNGNPLQCSCLENPRDGGAWWAAVYGVAQSRTRLK